MAQYGHNMSYGLGMLMLSFVKLRQGSLLSALILAASLGACAPQPKAAPKVQTDQPATASINLNSMDADALYDAAMALVETDVAQAGLMFERAALQGHGEAAYQLGLLQTDAKRQIEWHSMAASVGQIDAQYTLGEAYLYGYGTAKEPAWGLSWFERAARAGHARAQYALGAAMATGLVGPAMREDALVWMIIAQNNGYADAALMVSLLQPRMSTSAWADIQDRAKAWTNEPAGDAEARANTRFAQYALRRLGFNAGLADGIQGDRTDMAVNAFRAAEGLRAGKLDGRTLDLLRERVALLNR